MTIKNEQIESGAKTREAESELPATGPGKGVFGVKTVDSVAEGFFKDSEGRDIQLTDKGSPMGGGGSSTLSGLSDTTISNPQAGQVLSHDGTDWKNTAAPASVSSVSDLTDTTITSLQDGDTLVYNNATSKFENSPGVPGPQGAAGNDGADGADGVGVPAGGSTGQVLAKVDNTDHNTQWVDASGGSSSEYKFTLPAAADIATRLGSVSGLPAGWSLDTADQASVAQLGSDAGTLVINFNATGKIALEIGVLELTASGPDATQGYSKVDLTTQGTVKTTTAGDKCAVIGLDALISTSKDIVVFVKLI